MTSILSFSHLCVVKIFDSNVRKRFDGADFTDDFKFSAELRLRLLQGLTKELSTLLRDFFHCDIGMK